MKNSILWDCHMHSSFSADSDTDMENMIKGAISRGLEGVCFTEHLTRTTRLLRISRFFIWILTHMHADCLFCEKNIKTAS